MFRSTGTFGYGGLRQDTNQFLNNFGQVSPESIRKRQMTVRNKRTKVTLPKLKFMEKENED